MKQVKAAAMPILTNRNINPAANSKFWLPLEGFWYFTKHPSLWKIVLLPICCAMLLDLIGVILLFALALVAQADLLLAVDGMPEAVAWLIAVALTFIECLLLVVVTASVVFGMFGSKLFKKTMELEGVPLNDDVPCREECWGDFWMGFFRFSLFVCLLPLHLIPCVGTVLFCYLNGCTPASLELFSLFSGGFPSQSCFAVLAGWDFHQSFFVSLRWSWQTQYNYVTSKKADYTYFGFGAMFLSMIPIGNFIFPFVRVICQI
jgi:hypothetical protein